MNWLTVDIAIWQVTGITWANTLPICLVGLVLVDNMCIVRTGDIFGNARIWKTRISELPKMWILYRNIRLDNSIWLQSRRIAGLLAVRHWCTRIHGSCQNASLRSNPSNRRRPMPQEQAVRHKPRCQSTEILHDFPNRQNLLDRHGPARQSIRSLKIKWRKLSDISYII